VPILLRVSCISRRALQRMRHSACVLLHSTYTDITSIERSGRRSSAAVRSAHCTGTCSASTSFRIQNMLRIAHLPSCWAVGVILVQFACPMGTVMSVSLFLHTGGSDIASTLKSFSRSSFMTLCWTMLCFRTFNWRTWSVLCMTGRVEHLTVLAERFVWASARHTLRYRLLAVLVVMSLLGASGAQAWFHARESLVSDCLASCSIVLGRIAVRRLWCRRILLRRGSTGLAAVAQHPFLW